MTSYTIPTDLPVDPHEALDVARTALDSVWDEFVNGMGAKASRFKESRTDFATEVDLALERQLSRALREGTGLEVHGEEYGGPPTNTGTLWVVDPIDGTANYSAGIPDCAILIALVHERQPVLGLTWLPMQSMRFTSIAGEALYLNGEELAPMGDISIREQALGLGSFNTGNRGTYTPAYRREVMERLSLEAARTRKFGSTGVDMAYVASSRLSAAVTFGHYAWDNAAGACHVRCAGGVVSDLEGEEWHIESQSMLAGSPKAHAEVRAILSELGDPASVTEASRRWTHRLPEGSRSWLQEGR